MRLENAEWLDDDDDLDGLADFEVAIATEVYAQSSYVTDTVDVTRISNTRLEVEFEPLDAGDTTIRVPMWTEITDVGDARVTILRGNSAVTTGTYTFATAIDDDTVVTIDDIVTFGPEEDGDLYPLYH